MSRTSQQLHGAALRHLRALAHPLKPLVQLGKNGWTEAVQAQLDQALTDHELIKVRLGTESPTQMSELRALAEQTLGAHFAQSIGSVAVLYRRHPQKPKIQLPRKNET